LPEGFFSAFSLRPSLLSSWLPFDLFSLSIFHGLCNGHQLQLIEYIESIKTDVKKKMTSQMLSSAHQSHQRRAPKSFARAFRSS
jgi:hypothetical protein